MDMRISPRAILRPDLMNAPAARPVQAGSQAIPAAQPLTFSGELPGRPTLMGGLRLLVAAVALAAATQAPGVLKPGATGQENQPAVAAQANPQGGAAVQDLGPACPSPIDIIEFRSEDWQSIAATVGGGTPYIHPSIIKGVTMWSRNVGVKDPPADVAAQLQEIYFQVYRKDMIANQGNAPGEPPPLKGSGYESRVLKGYADRVFSQKPSPKGPRHVDAPLAAHRMQKLIEGQQDLDCLVL